MLPGCLDALAAQSYRDFSALVVDDCSTDDSVQLVERDSPWARVLQVPRNLGFAGAVNAGIRATSAPYVALLNSDAEARPEWLAELVSAIHRRPNVGWCASKMVFPDGLINSAGQMFLPEGHAVDIGFGEPDDGRFGEMRYVFGACGGAALYRRLMLQAIGLFDEDFFLLVEDVDLNFRAQLRGWRCLYVPRAEVVHRHAATRSALGRRNWYHSARNSLYCLLKDLPASLWVKHLPAVLRYQWAAAFEWTALGRWDVWMAAHLSLFTRLGRILRQRADTQSHRRVSAAQLERAFSPLPVERGDS